ncbi:hypothetical protein HKX48_000317 [Thoreauomyces humboldtii]|nr:hypothetical protein HKX48_000317 [Thoreauomyces humboldtii]
MLDEDSPTGFVVAAGTTPSLAPLPTPSLSPTPTAAPNPSLTPSPIHPVATAAPRTSGFFTSGTADDPILEGSVSDDETGYPAKKQKRKASGARVIARRVFDKHSYNRPAISDSLSREYSTYDEPAATMATADIAETLKTIMAQVATLTADNTELKRKRNDDDIATEALRVRLEQESANLAAERIRFEDERRQTAAATLAATSSKLLPTDMNFYKGIDVFDPETSTHAKEAMESWILAMDLFVNVDCVNANVPDAKLAQLAKGKLKGHASSLIRDCPTYEAMKAVLQKQWGEEMEEVSLCFALGSMTVTTTMIDFVHRFNATQSRLKGASPEFATIYMFLQNIPDNIRKRLTTLGEVQRSACTLFDNLSSPEINTANAVNDRKKQKERKGGDQYCSHHQVNTHNTVDCRAKAFHGVKREQTLTTICDS